MAMKGEKKDLFTGKPDGLTWEKFDDKVISWGRRKFGNAYAIALWKDELLALKSIDLQDELDKAAFEDHCDQVYDMLIQETPKYASDMAKDARFKTIRWHQDHRQRQREKLFCYLEEITDGEVKRQLKKRGVHQMNTMRSYFFNRFGHGSPAVLMERQRVYLLGMPGPSGEVFPPRVNMEEKLNSLEEEREFLIDMCPVDKRADYNPGKLSTLVRLILENLPAEYDAAVKDVRNLHRLRKYGESGDVAHISNKEENERVNYEDSWLPPYDELRVELVDTWRLLERRRKGDGKTYKKSNPGHPVLPILPGHEQPGPNQRRCYGCGLFGHSRGDPKCKAGADAVWKGAPQVWRDRQGKRTPDKKRKLSGPKGKGRGKGDGGAPYLRNKGNRQDDQEKEKGICFNWSRGTGYCKYANACKYKHEGPKGGEKRSATTMVSAKQRKKLSSLIVKDIKSSLKSDDDDGDSDNVHQAKRTKLNAKAAEDHVYRLISGVPSVIITREDGSGDEWEGGEFGSKIIDKDTLVPATKDEMRFVVTLMISSSAKDGGDFVPEKPEQNDPESKIRGAGQSNFVAEKTQGDDVDMEGNDLNVSTSLGGEMEEITSMFPLPRKVIDRTDLSDVRKVKSVKNSIFEKNKFENREFMVSRGDLLDDKVGSSSQGTLSLDFGSSVSNEETYLLERLATNMLSSVEMYHNNALPFLSFTRTSLEMEREQASSSGEAEDTTVPSSKVPSSVEMIYGKPKLGVRDSSVEMGRPKGVQIGDMKWSEHNLREIEGFLAKDDDEWHALAKQIGDVLPLVDSEKDRASARMMRSWSRKVREDWNRHVEKCEKDAEDSFEKLEGLKRKVERAFDDLDKSVDSQLGIDEQSAHQSRIETSRAGFRSGVGEKAECDALGEIAIVKRDELEEVVKTPLSMLHTYVCIVNDASAYVSFINRELSGESREDGFVGPFNMNMSMKDIITLNKVSSRSTVEPKPITPVNEKKEKLIRRFKDQRRKYSNHPKVVVGKFEKIAGKRKRRFERSRAGVRGDSPDKGTTAARASSTGSSNAVEESLGPDESKTSDDELRSSTQPMGTRDPLFHINESVYYWTGAPWMEFRKGRIISIVPPGVGRDRTPSPQASSGGSSNKTSNFYYKLIDDDDDQIGERAVTILYAEEKDIRVTMVYANEKDVRCRWEDPRSSCMMNCLQPNIQESPFSCLLNSGGTNALHSLDYVGVDTCSAMSVSSEVSDFLYIDTTDAARNSISLRGVGGEHTSVGGRGPMLISTLDSEGQQVYLVDPSGVYIKGSSKQFRLRILGQQRMKSFGFDLVQNKDGDGVDYLVYQAKNRHESSSDGMETRIPLETVDGILMIRSHASDLSANGRVDENFKALVEEHVRNLRSVSVQEGEYLFKLTKDREIAPLLVINEAELTLVEQNRLEHWRYGHRNRTGQRHEERCPACEQAKHKVGSFKRNLEYYGSSESTKIVYHRLWCDSYGGQRSMGEESYQGASGGFVFVCPVSGRIKVKLYATTKQFPAVLFQVLQEIEGEGYSTREIYVDTFSVNLSRAAEQVAAMFKCRLVPVSAGTPQEMAFAERAVQTIAQMSRSLMAGAPHLPEYCWGLSDLYSAYIHMVIPQKARNGRSPYEITTGREPDPDVLAIHVFGCPTQYEPHEGAIHKRATKTQWGWFVGIQWPMVLILRPDDEKVVSVSRKKVHYHEEAYAKFDYVTMSKPHLDFKDYTLSVSDVEEALQETDKQRKVNIREAKANEKIPDHVLSVKSLSSHTRNDEFNTPTPKIKPPTAMLEPQTRHLGEDNGHDDENVLNVQPRRLKIDDLLEVMGIWRNRVKKGEADGNQTKRIVEAIKLAEDSLYVRTPKKGGMKSKRKVKLPDGVNEQNVISKRMRKKMRSAEKKVDKIGESASTKSKHIFEIGQRVKIRTVKFGEDYAIGKPRYTHGTVKKIHNNLVHVLWDGSKRREISHAVHLTKTKSILSCLVGKDLLESGIESESVECLESFADGRRNYPKTWTVKSILPILEVGASVSNPSQAYGGTYPKDFYEALVRPDWRLWVEAVKSENESWSAFEACTEVSFADVEVGASVIPLGELFTMKRSGKYKFRQIALGNMLREGKDYAETFASTVSGDGLRWFCSLASTCGKEIRGWDATTGYLQTEQRVPVYAYLPSHYGYSDLEYEGLAQLRDSLLKVLKEQGAEGIKLFSRRMRNERRVRPSTVLKLNKSVYGIPDAGQSFAMFMLSLHLKKCDMVQSEIDPCIFYKFVQREVTGSGEKMETVLMEYIIAITWVDDVRYFGTSNMVKEYEATIAKNCKCTFEGASKDFVSLQIFHDIEGKVLELKQEDYWVNAIERFKEFLGPNGPKERQIPLSPADEKLLVEPSDDELKAAAHLPYASLLGVVQYPSCYTKIEMKYCVSVLSRWRTKWSCKHFEILVKALEYGYATRHMGLRYDGNGKPDEINVLVGYADSALTVPRSQGSRLLMMNGAAITMTSKRHTTTDDSTLAAELTEAYLLACEVEGFRNLMAEVGLEQKAPTTLFQDNQAAIQVAMNRGSLSRKTRGTELRVLTYRNKVEDMKVVPIYLGTKDMIADIGTKSLDPKTFIRLRDLLLGYTASTGKQ